MQGRGPGGGRARVAVEGGREVLDEIDLIHVSTRDGVTNPANGTRVVTRRPRLLPRAKAKRRLSIIVIIDNVVLGADGAGRERKGTGLGRGGRMPAADHRREPVAEVEVGDEPL